MERAKLKSFLDELVRDRDALYQVERDGEWWRQFVVRWEHRFEPQLRELVKLLPADIVQPMIESVGDVDSRIEDYIRQPRRLNRAPSGALQVRDGYAQLTNLLAQLAGRTDWPIVLPAAPTTMEREQISIFWAWQSDYRRSRNQIFDALERVVEMANLEWRPVSPIVLAQATELGEGAVRIDRNLLDKIQRADLVVADATPVAVLEDNLYPNANVLIELGYALASKPASEVYLVEHIERTQALQAQSATEQLIVDFPFDIRNVNRIRYTAPEELRSRLKADLKANLLGRKLLRG